MYIIDEKKEYCKVQVVVEEVEVENHGCFIVKMLRSFDPIITRLSGLLHLVIYLGLDAKQRITHSFTKE